MERRGIHGQSGYKICTSCFTNDSLPLSSELIVLLLILLAVELVTLLDSADELPATERNIR